MDVLPSIPEFFKDKEIFITGGSGFIGKAIVEILLRTCDVKIIYLLIREKKGVTSQDRLEEILNNALFDVVRKNKPEALKRVTAISGDVSELKLGLSHGDRERLLGVQIVLHAAASIRFHDVLKKAILMNTRGTREVMELLLEMRNLEVAVHVSTTYCNTDKHVIEERVYRDHGDWREAIRIAEEDIDEYKVACLTEKILGGLRNTYTYTKHLAENIVEDYSDKLPLVLFRPGVVISTWKDPTPGWHDNYYGPIGFGIAVGKGIMRTTYTGTTLLQDYMPLDMVVKALIVATWQKSAQFNSNVKLPVYNCSVLGKLEQSHSDWSRIGLKVIREQPYSGMFWYPDMNTCTNETMFKIHYVLKHVLPGIFLDTGLRIMGKKPMFINLFKKLFIGMMTIAFFLTRKWDFRSENMWGLVEKLKPEDRENFSYSFDGYDLEEYMQNALMGSRKFLLKEPEDYEKDRRVFRKNAMIHFSIKYSAYGLLLYFVYASGCITTVMSYLYSQIS